jgi:hypothetical protein
MTSRITSLVLASFFALLFALAAHAGEISMDIGGMHANGEAVPCNSRADLDESVTTPPDSATTEAASTSHAQWRSSASISNQRQLGADTETGSAPSQSAPGASANAISAQSRPRNRWQSLVPGAIK